ncbi:MAG TPA: TIGR03618 family F420-dependent PPOX class oxidoreductase [Acidimicrobiales bacterium]|jgi:PPOX class probable F420-dependent enzyme|nr:TIGR03618 family F420-dependent PPOX class oxidoreductase [Acidimicrobiales bacterium]|tara:strand:- start:108 stop:503 length:396 start_codon:yes stop_codon:yes gene_type:complete
MSLNPLNLSEEVRSFLGERHLASLTLLRPDGSPHVTAVGFTWDQANQLVRVITWAGSMKSRILAQSPNTRAVVCQIDGGRWLSLEGTAVVTNNEDRCREGTERYAERYREPQERQDRTVIEISVDRILGYG